MPILSNANTGVQTGPTIATNVRPGSVSLCFPADLNSKLDEYPFCFINVKDPVAKGAAVNFYVGLPMPTSLKVNYKANWQEVELGITETGKNLIYNDKNLMNAVGEAAVWAMRNVANATGLALNAQFSKENRVVINNHAALLFQSMAFREFQLDYMFYPRNSKDTQQLFKIIYNLKYAMHPGFSNDVGSSIPSNPFLAFGNISDGLLSPAMSSTFFNYPQEFVIGFFVPKAKKIREAPIKTENSALNFSSWYSNLTNGISNFFGLGGGIGAGTNPINTNTHSFYFNTRNCALIDMQVEYHGHGVPSYFEDGAPTAVQMTLHFKEVEVLTKKEIAAGA